MKARWTSAAVFLGSSLVCNAFAGGGPLGIDHKLEFDESGIWARSNQKAVQAAATLVVVGGALWEGSDSRIGSTFWKASESMLAADVSAEVLKRTFRRARPSQGGPDDWFGPSSHKSFPSGEVAHITAIVTPFIAEYGKEQPLAWGLASLPVYVGIARMKSQAHWQTDVLAGAALGAGLGYYEYTRESAWSVTALPRGITVGLKKKF